MNNTILTYLVTYDVVELLRDPEFTTEHLPAETVYVGVQRPRNDGSVARYDQVLRELEVRLKKTVRELLEIEARSHRAQRVPSLVMRFIAEVRSAAERPQFSNGVFQACCIIQEIIEVQEMRRAALLRHIDEAAQRSVTDITLEIRQREREIERTFGDMEIPVSENHAVVSVYREQQDFAKDVISQLLPVLEKVKASPNRKPQAEEVKQKARAKAEMKVQMSKERDDLQAKYPEQQQEINRMYRKMFDELEESA